MGETTRQHMPTDDNRGTVKSDRTLLRIISALQDHGSVGVTRLATELDVSKATVHKHLKTLNKTGYVHNDDGEYRLGLKFLEHGGYVRDNTRIYSVGREYVMDLSEETGEMVILAIKEFDIGTFVFRSKDPFGLIQTVPIGQRFLLHQNAAGKAILAELPDEEVERIIDESNLAASTENTITDRSMLFDQLDEIREQGYSMNLGEKSEGVWAVGAAVRDPHLDKIGAMSITVPESVTSKQKLTGEYSDALIETVGALNLRLRHDVK